ncbi:uncharacterized protein [Venturia canescens]|uniref:uncharacterized protein n=1 Tax=Venturia canescens TaxID=32260 RepID=UPI001C9BD05A|nr:uncharacterized protein LOC122408380 [Venturia canescens]
MLRKVLLLSLACVGTVLSTTESQQIKWPGTRRVEEPCARDRECVGHAFCKNQKFCLCETYYAPSLDKSTCHVTLGAPCNTDWNQACETMTNAECRQNVCACKDNFMIDIHNSSNCIIRPRAPGDTCHRTDDCKETMQMAYCIDNVCRCYTDHHFVNETGTCLKRRGIYEPCKSDYECYESDKRPNQLECRNGECACRIGEPDCNKGSALHQPIFLVIATITVRSIHRNLL